MPARVSEDPTGHTGDVPPTSSELVISKDTRVVDPVKKRRKKKYHGDSAKRKKWAGDQSSKGKEVSTTQEVQIFPEENAPLLEEIAPISSPVVD